MSHSLLRRASRGLVGDAAVYILAAAMNAALPFLLLPLIARWLGPSDFGVIGSFVAIVNVLILLVGLNAYGFVGVGYYRDGPETLPRLVGAAIAIILAAAVLLGLLGWIGAGPIERLTRIDRDWLWALLVAATGQAIIAVGLAVAQTIRKPFVYIVLQLGYGALLAILTLLSVGMLGMGWPGRALAQAIAAFLVAGGAIAWLRASGRLTILDGGDVRRRALQFGMPLLPHSLAAVAMGSMDRLALADRFSPAVVGQYFLGLQLASVFTAFAAAVNQAWVPWLYERLARNDTAAWAEIGSVIRIGGGLLVAGVVAMIAVGRPLVLLVGGQSYLSAIAPLRILACYAGCQAWYTLMSAFLFYAKRPRLLSSITVSSAVVQGALILWLVRWGTTGVAAALLVTAAAAALVMSAVVRQIVVAHQSTAPSAA